MKQNTKSLIRRTANVNSLMIIIFYVLDILLIRVGGWIVGKVAADSKYLYDIAELVSYCIQYLIVVPIVLMIFKLISGNKEGLKIFASFRKPLMPAKWIARWIVISIGLIYAANYINSFFFAYIQSASDTQLNGVDFTSSGTLLGAITSFLAMSVLAPFFEELMFRGTLYRNTEKVGQWTGVVMIGLTFGLWHGSYQQILYAAVMGACACFLVAKTGSIIPSLILHISLNTIGAVQSIALGQIDLDALQDALTKQDMAYISAHSTPLFIVITMALLVFALMITGLVFFFREIKFHRESFTLINFCPDVPQGKKFLIYLTSPVTLICFAGLIIITIRVALGLGIV